MATPFSVKNGGKEDLTAKKCMTWQPYARVNISDLAARFQRPLPGGTFLLTLTGNPDNTVTIDFIAGHYTYLALGFQDVYMSGSFTVTVEGLTGRVTNAQDLREIVELAIKQMGWQLEITKETEIKTGRYLQDKMKVDLVIKGTILKSLFHEKPIPFPVTLGVKINDNGEIILYGENDAYQEDVKELLTTLNTNTNIKAVLDTIGARAYNVQRGKDRTLVQVRV